MSINIKEQYYSLPEEELQTLITNAQRGDPRARTQLLYEFRNFLTKYVTLLYYCKYDYRNYDMRKFIALYVADSGIRFRLLRGKSSPRDQKSLAKILHDLQFMIQRYGDEEDVRQTVEMTFLQCLPNYKRSKSKSKPDEWIPFSGYIYNYYYFLLKRNVDAFLIDQNARTTFPLITESDMLADDSNEMPPGYTEPPEPSAEDLLGPDIIDEFWVVGDTALFPFDSLSIQERQLLKWRYVDGLRSSEIAQRITEHPNTVRERFARIKERIKTIIVEGLDNT
jgi:hypothetical protein